MRDPELTLNAGIAELDIWSRCLLKYARCALPLPGRKSAFRKFRRRRTGSRFQVFTRHGFQLSLSLCPLPAPGWSGNCGARIPYSFDDLKR